MLKSLPPRLQSEYARRLIRQMAGSSKWTVVVGAVVLLVSLGWATNASWDLLCHVPWLGKDESFPWIMDVLGTVFFLAVVGVLWWWSRRASQTIRVTVIQDAQPPQVKALVLFLSPVGPDAPLLNDLLEGREVGNLRDVSFRARFQAAWRMPLEAIAYHLGRLQQVILIPSADHIQPDRPLREGTVHDVPRFVELVAKLLGPPCLPTPLQVRSLAECLSDRQAGGHAPRDYARGVAFENVETLVDAVEDAYDILTQLKIPNYEILVDVTSGQRPPAVAGATVALAEGRRFQYVSTLDYQVRTYDVTYLA